MHGPRSWGIKCALHLGMPEIFPPNECQDSSFFLSMAVSQIQSHIMGKQKSSFSESILHVADKDI